MHIKQILGWRRSLQLLTLLLFWLLALPAFASLPQTIVDPNGVVTTLAYDVRERPTTTSVATSGGARTTTRGYDAAGNLTSLTLPDNSAIAYGYDTAHRLVTLADSAGDTTTLTLDNAGDVTASVTAPQSGPATASSAATYDALGRRPTLTPAGSGHATTWTWDNDGNALTVTDGLAHKTSFTWDQLNRLTAKTDPANTQFTYTYDAQNHLTTRNTPPVRRPTSGAPGESCSTPAIPGPIAAATPMLITATATSPSAATATAAPSITPTTPPTAA